MVNIPLKTKLYVPPLRLDVVPRPRLIDRLNEGLECKLTLVSAPAGFGKTTLLSRWIKESKRPTAWVSLDRGDNDLVRFLTYFLAALQSIQEGIGASSTRASLETIKFGASLASIESQLAGLINEIAEVPFSFTLVLEDYHTITEPSIHEMTLFLLENLPPPMHLVISTRMDPPWPLARLRVRRAANELRASELRFTPEEATIFLNQVMKLNLSPDHITALEERTEGWIAGLQMAALSLQGRSDAASFITAFTGSNRFIFDYLVEEVLEQQSHEMKNFLLETSILERLSAPLCNAVTGRTDSQKILASLDQLNLFLVPLDDERCWYRYHHLFSGLLRSQLEKSQPDQLPILHHRASQWYEYAGNYEEAVSHAFVGKDLARAAVLIDQNATTMYIQNKLVMLAHWIELLPDDLVRTHPWLCAYYAWTCYWTGRRERVEEYLQAAEMALASMLASTGNDPQAVLSESSQRHLTGHIAAVRAHNALTNQDIPRVLEMSEKALALLPEEDDMRCETAVALGGAYWGKGDVKAAYNAFVLARASALKSGYPSMSVPAACYAGMQQVKQGQLHAAFDTFQEALQMAVGPGGTELPVAGFPKIRLGDLYREWNELETAAGYLKTGLDQCRLLGQADVLTDGYVALARLLFTQGNMDEAVKFLDKADQLASRTKIDPFVVCWLDELRVKLWLATGDLGAAVRRVEQSSLRVESELSYQSDLHHTNLARVLIARGVGKSSKADLNNALALLARLRAAAETAGWTHELIKILVLQSLATLAVGHPNGALDAMTQALSLAEPGGYQRVFVDEGQPAAKIISGVLAAAPQWTYLNGLLAAFKEGGEHRVLQKTSAGPLIEPLTDREVEVLRRLNSSLSSTEIAAELYVAVSTVRTHIKNIYGKLDVNQRFDAIQRAKELGLL